jgi:hypothetical protein
VVVVVVVEVVVLVGVEAALGAVESLRAPAADVATTVARSAVRRWAASDNTVCSSVESFARAIVICPPRRRASLTREWICVVESRIVVVVAGSPEAVLEGAPPLSAADPPTTAPPTSTTETTIDRPLIGPPMALTSSSDR